MKIFIILFLSCALLAAADTNGWVCSSVSTNAGFGTVLTRETFARGGQTNLIRIIKVQSGHVIFRSQQFCHNGKPVAMFSFRDGVQSFSTEPNVPYRVDVEFLPTKDVKCVIILGRDFIDGFYPTNGIYYPAPDSDLKMEDFK